MKPNEPARGPWTVQGLIITAPGGWEIAVVSPVPNAAANARLMACAPELLEALEAARNFGSQGETHEGISVSYLIEKAIDKAKGQIR